MDARASPSLADETAHRQIMADQHHRKIDLQSPSDLLYLQTNILAVAQQKLDLHLPPSAAQGKDDAFRARVDQLVQAYIAQTLALALPSVSINGLDASPSLLNPEQSSTGRDDTSLDPNDPSYEPYDTRLAQKLRDLYASLEEETTKIAELRREAPARAAAQYVEKLWRDMNEEEQEFEGKKVEASEETDGGLHGAGFQDGESVRQMWERGRQGLEDLKNVTKVKADLERAVRAAAEVER